VAIDFPEDAKLLGAPLSGLPVEEGEIHAPVQAVFVHGFKATLQPRVFAVQLGHGLIAEALLIGMALAKR